jgi:acyl-coenzyme A thioesterase PaaI-like protein
MAEPIDPLLFGAEQRCFGCGPNHEHGLKLRFERDGDLVFTRHLPGPEHQGPPGLMHGGLQATLADELAGWTLLGLRSRMGYTTAIDVRLIRPVRIGVEVVGRGEILVERGAIAVVGTRFSQDGKTTLMGRVSYRLTSAEEYERTLGRPIPEAWKRFGGP